MSWKSYNATIAAIREGRKLSLSDARTYYDALKEELGHAPTVEDIEIPEDYEDFDDWEEAYEDGEFDDYPEDELAGGINTGKAKK